MERLKSFYYDKKTQVGQTTPPSTSNGREMHLRNRLEVLIAMPGRPLLLDGHRPVWLRPGHDEPHQHQLRLPQHHGHRGG